MNILKIQFYVDLYGNGMISPQRFQMIWLETPTNPLLNLTDIKAVSEIAKSKNPEILIVVDNTFLTAYFQVLFLLIFKINYEKKCFILF